MSQPRSRRQLNSITGEAAAIAGKLSFSLGNHGDAVAYYRLAEGLAADTGDQTLRAYVLGQTSHLYSELFAATNRSRAIAVLDEAINCMGRSAPPLLQTWLRCRRAEEHAAAGMEAAALADLDAADRSLSQVRSKDEAFLSHWDTAPHARLAGYRGSCLQLLNRPAEAISAIEYCLPEIDPSAVTVRSSVLADLAAAHIKSKDRDLERACILLRESLTVASGADLAAYIWRVLNVRRELESWKDAAAVQDLDRYLQAIA